EQRAKKSLVERRTPGKLVRQGWVPQSLLLRSQRRVSIGERAEAVELIKAIDQQEESVNRRRNLGVRNETVPQLQPSNTVKPQDGQEEDSGCDQIQSSGEASQQV